MRCPHDNTDLVATDRQGVDIRTCPTCEGVWLERGALDDIINRSIPRHLTTRGRADDDDRYDDDRRRRRDKYSDDAYLDNNRKPKKKKRTRDLLDDLLDS